MSSDSQNLSFPGFRKQRIEVTNLISKNIKAGFLSVDSNSTLKGNLTVNGLSTLTSGVQVGTNGTNLYKVVSGTVSVDPGSISTDTRGSVNVTITGLNTVDRIILHPPTALNTNLLYCGCDITAANTLTIYLYNKSGGSIDDGANTWKYTYFIFND